MEYLDNPADTKIISSYYVSKEEMINVKKDSETPLRNHLSDIENTCLKISIKLSFYNELL